MASERHQRAFPFRSAPHCAGASCWPWDCVHIGLSADCCQPECSITFRSGPAASRSPRETVGPLHLRSKVGCQVTVALALVAFVGPKNTGRRSRPAVLQSEQSATKKPRAGGPARGLLFVAKMKIFFGFGGERIAPYTRLVETLESPQCAPSSSWVLLAALAWALGWHWPVNPTQSGTASSIRSQR